MALIHWPFPRAIYIDHDRDFRQWVKKLEREALIAVDTESNSLHAYRERVCLVQLSTRTADAIIDPLRIADLSPLGDLLAAPAIEKVFHAAEYDLMCLKRDYGFTLNNLFDTMMAARILGLKAVGLNKLLAEFCGVDSNKRHQRDDWGQRPLPEEGLLYAQMDTHFLPELRDKLRAKLQAMERLEEAAEMFDDACHVPIMDNTFDPEGYWRIGIPADLNRRQMGILRQVYLLRDRLAQERDVPPFKVFSNAALVALAELAPTSISGLAQLRGLSPSQARRYGRELLGAINQGRNAPRPQPPERPPDIDPALIERYTALHDWRKERAEGRGVESDVIISKEALWAVARKMPVTLDDLSDIRGLGPWRRAAYGPELLTILDPFR